MDIRTICMYCHKHLKGNPQALRISHGCCKECFNKEITKVNAMALLGGVDEEIKRYKASKQKE